MIRAILEFAAELALFAWDERQRKRLGISDLQRRVRDLEAKAERMEQEDEMRRRHAAMLRRVG